MKFIHTGDIHYGMAPDAGRSWSKERAEAVRDAVPSIIEAVRAERADLLLIAGDLFHHQPLVRELKEVNYLSLPSRRRKSSSSPEIMTGSAKVPRSLLSHGLKMFSGSRRRNSPPCFLRT